MISTKLVNDTLSYYDNYRHEDVVVNPSLPILYFGDLEAYANSEIKILTVGKNPSVNEFRLNRNDLFSFVRFPNWDTSKRNLIESLNPYFREKPLRQWFSSFEPILNGLAASYYNGRNSNIALHTDICSPLATNPTWSKLPKEKQDLLFREGVLIWKNLIEELQPDIMLISVPQLLFRSLFSMTGSELVVFEKKKNGDLRKKPYSVFDHNFKLQNGKNVKVVFGLAANKPFDTISEQQKKRIGEICLK